MKQVQRHRFSVAILALLLIVAVLVGGIALAPPPSPNRGGSAGASATTLPKGFQESIVLRGLTDPTVVRFASDGRVFVAEKSGVIKEFDSLADTTATVVADLNTNVYNFWDRGMLGMALAPNFPADPSIYVLYAYDHELGSAAPPPRWGTPGVYSDGCPTPPGAGEDGCVVSGRLSRLQIRGNVMVGSEHVLIEDWCHQYPSHSIGSLEFGPEGALYASGGEGASFNFVDYGQAGSPRNPCGDPPGGVGAILTPPTAEGGALRAQDLRTSADPTGLGGTVIRVDPATGDGWPTNPLASSTDPNARRIIAYGLRNPFRIALRPGTNEVWIGDVGWDDWEEINRITSTNDGAARNFGWPCYEGNGRQPGYDAANLDICEALYTAGGATSPFFTYNHHANVVANDGCQPGSSSISGLQFQLAANSNYPPEYRGALFFADYARHCIWVMPAGTDGQPAPGRIEPFIVGASTPVHLQMGPDGNLYYADIAGGAIRRILYTAGNQPPHAAASASPLNGAAPLTVHFDGSASRDPDPGDVLSYSWDLDGDGAFGDSTAVQPTFTYASNGTYGAALKVTDSKGSADTATVTIVVGNTPPRPVIRAPAGGTPWKVGDVIAFSGSAADAEDGAVPASALTWQLVEVHCPSNCHEHLVRTYAGVASGSFSAPDHEYPSYLELRLTAKDRGGLTATATARLDPRTVVLTFQSAPGGLDLVVNGAGGTGSFERTVIVGSNNSVSAVSPPERGRTYTFQSWSDGGAQSHNIVAPATATTYTARFQ